MGLPDGGTGTTGGVTTPKIFKCILNMDAYIRVSGGTDEVRSIQRWLNGRYWTKDAYSIGPADGIYSRDVQKSLMIAIQYELGIAAPNGNFGPATQDGLRMKNFGEGASGLWVELFSAACVFNSPVPTGSSDTGTPTTWRSNYDGKLREWVQVFQRFCKLPDSGRSDYQTWAQLLVSMGDADRPATGSDTRFEITASRAQWLRANGYTVVGRYLYDPPGSTLDKEIKPGELQTIFSNGLKVFPIYQDNARKLSDFTYTQGYQHALNAHSLAESYGFNRGTVIYFAVDYDATREEIDAAIVPYFHGVAAGTSVRWSAGRPGPATPSCRACRGASPATSASRSRRTGPSTRSRSSRSPMGRTPSTSTATWSPAPTPARAAWARRPARPTTSSTTSGACTTSRSPTPEATATSLNW
jgi:peptidoglycan hydrolase-like protein with peptidoglycan-binding domain